MKRRPAMSRTSVINLTTGRAARVERHRRGKWTPALALDFGATWIVVRTSHSTRVTADDVAFARELAAQAQSFAEEIARRYTHTIPPQR